MTMGNLLFIQTLFLLLQVVLGILSFKLDNPFLLYASHLCCVVVIYLMFAILLN